MGIFIKDPATDKAVRKLAKLKGMTLTEAIKTAVLRELAEAKPDDDLAKLEELYKFVGSFPKTGLKGDKAFFDSLYED